MRRATASASAAVLIAALGATSAAGAADPPRMTQPVHATNSPDEAPARSYSSPHMVVDPDDPRKVYAASVDTSTQRCHLLRSGDGGRTWVKPDASPSPEGFPFCTHDSGFVPLAFVALGRDKTLYYFHLGFDAQDGGRAENRSVFLARSTDEGESWTSTPVNVNRGKQDEAVEKNIATGLAVDTTTGDRDKVYVAYRASYPNPATPARPSQPFVAASTDGGATFGTPVNVAASYNADPANIPADVPDDRRRPENFGGSNLSLAVDARGTVYGVWGRSTANITPAPPGVTVLSRSTDGGATWASSVMVPPDQNRTGPSGLALAWSPGGSASGSLHAVWEGKLVTTQGDRDTIYQRSLDEGQTWSEPRLLNDDDPAELFGQFQPSIAVAPNGRLEVAWWDMRDSAGLFATDVYGVSSTDNGATWSANRRITDRIIDRTIGVWKPGTGGDVRQPPGLAAADALTVVMWDDTRNGSPQVETQDLFAATIQYSALARTSGLSRTAGYLLAGSVGVLAVGLMLVVGSVVMRGRSTTRAAPATPGREPVEVG